MSKIIDALLIREGRDKETNHPEDKGGRTKWGISERANPKAWADGDVTEAEAREIFETKYVNGPGFDKISDPSLRESLIDFGVMSGPGLAISKLQSILKVDQDGILGPKTLAAIAVWEPRRLTNKLALERVKMASRIVKRDPTQLKFIEGWINRFSEFVD